MEHEQKGKSGKCEFCDQEVTNGARICPACLDYYTDIIRSKTEDHRIQPISLKGGGKVKKGHKAIICSECGLTYLPYRQNGCPKCHPTKIILESSVRRSTIPPARPKNMGILLDDDR